MEILHKDVNEHLSSFQAIKIISICNLLLTSISKQKAKEGIIVKWNNYEKAELLDDIRTAIGVMELRTDEVKLLLKPCYVVDTSNKEIDLINPETNSMDLQLKPIVLLNAAAQTVFNVFGDEDFQGYYLKKNIKNDQ